MSASKVKFSATSEPLLNCVFELELLSGLTRLPDLLGREPSKVAFSDNTDFISTASKAQASSSLFSPIKRTARQGRRRTQTFIEKISTAERSAKPALEAGQFAFIDFSLLEKTVEEKVKAEIKKNPINFNAGDGKLDESLEILLGLYRDFEKPILHKIESIPRELEFFSDYCQWDPEDIPLEVLVDELEKLKNLQQILVDRLQEIHKFQSLQVEATQQLTLFLNAYRDDCLREQGIVSAKLTLLLEAVDAYFNEHKDELRPFLERVDLICVSEAPTPENYKKLPCESAQGFVYHQKEVYFVHQVTAEISKFTLTKEQQDLFEQIIKDSCLSQDQSLVMPEDMEHRVATVLELSALRFEQKRRSVLQRHNGGYTSILAQLAPTRTVQLKDFFKSLPFARCDKEEIAACGRCYEDILRMGVLNDDVLSLAAESYIPSLASDRMTKTQLRPHPSHPNALAVLLANENLFESFMQFAEKKDKNSLVDLQFLKSVRQMMQKKPLSVELIQDKIFKPYFHPKAKGAAINALAKAKAALKSSDKNLQLQTLSELLYALIPIFNQAFDRMTIMLNDFEMDKATKELRADLSQLDHLSIDDARLLLKELKEKHENAHFFMAVIDDEECKVGGKATLRAQFKDFIEEEISKEIQELREIFCDLFLEGIADTVYKNLIQRMAGELNLKNYAKALFSIHVLSLEAVKEKLSTMDPVDSSTDVLPVLSPAVFSPLKKNKKNENFNLQDCIWAVDEELHKHKALHREAMKRIEGVKNAKELFLQAQELKRIVQPNEKAHLFGSALHDLKTAILESEPSNQQRNKIRSGFNHRGKFLFPAGWRSKRGLGGKPRAASEFQLPVSEDDAFPALKQDSQAEVILGSQAILDGNKVEEVEFKWDFNSEQALDLQPIWHSLKIKMESRIQPEWQAYWTGCQEEESFVIKNLDIYAKPASAAVAEKLLFKIETGLPSQAGSALNITSYCHEKKEMDWAVKSVFDEIPAGSSKEIYIAVGPCSKAEKKQLELKYARAILAQDAFPRIYTDDGITRSTEQTKQVLIRLDPSMARRYEKIGLTEAAESKPVSSRYRFLSQNLPFGRRFTEGSIAVPLRV